MNETLQPDARYTAREVALLVLRHRLRWFYVNRARLEAEGFPRPISSVGRPRWSGADLIAWEQRPKIRKGVALPAGVVDLRVVMAARAEAVARRS